MSRLRNPRRAALELLVLAVCAGVAPSRSQPAASAQERAGAADEIEMARRDADRERRRGQVKSALRTLDDLLDEDEHDAAARTLRASCYADLGRWSEALAEARRAFEDAPPAERALRGECARNLIAMHLKLGDAAAASAVVEQAGPALDPGNDARDAWAVGNALWLGGQRESARKLLGEGIAGDTSTEWRRLLARARCERKLGFLERASRTLIEADRAAEQSEGREPDVLAETASVYFEADGELQHAKAQRRAPGELYTAARELSPGHEAAALGLFELGRFNWNRQNRSPHEYLDELLASAPHSIEGLLAGASADLDDGQLVSLRQRLSILRGLAPLRREVRTLEAALAWVEHRRDDAQAILAALHAQDPADAAPEREIARHLSELYRFAEAVPLARAATERDPQDYLAWMELGRALSNTGDEEQGLAALEKSKDLAAGRQNAWRYNTALVLQRTQAQFVDESGPGELSYAWKPDAAEVLRTYLVPFYAAARGELAERYAFTPGATRIEVFDRHRDFSVRSTGFEGFPALGVCFGPVVTAVSPVSELRGKFSWARTSFHEFTHVIHLGLSHNRCPRWITEGLATWEEEHKHPSWSRNLRRDLIDALANRDLIPVRDLNRAFRGPRILFGYYQGGLLCRMLIEERGFTPMIRTLEGFDRGLDLDQVLEQVFALTPEQLDQQFEQYVRAYVAPLKLEPRWNKAATARTKLGLSERRPEDASQVEAWSDAWCTVAWSAYQNGQRVDAEQALRRLDQAGLVVPRALFLRAELALAKHDSEAARELYEAGFAAGGDDYRARMALGKVAAQAELWDEAERHFLAAERCFPGYAENEFSAELHLAQLYGENDRVDDMQRARERWLAHNADDYPLRLDVARWHARAGRVAEAERHFREANEVDPFRRALHREWGEVLSAAGRHEEALREFGVALIVPAELDGDEPGPLDDQGQAELLGLQALELVALGRTEEAARIARRALELDADQEQAARALERAQ